MIALAELFHFPKLGSKLITLSNRNNLNFLLFFYANNNLSFSFQKNWIRDVFEPLRDITLTTLDLLNSRWMMGCAIFGLHHHVIVYTLFQNGRHFSFLLFTCLVASFLNSKFKEYFPLNKATRVNLQVNKRILKWRPVWNKVYMYLKVKFWCHEVYLELARRDSAWGRYGRIPEVHTSWE